MNDSINSRNKRIAKNTIALYIRTFIVLLIGLYTGRAVLGALGVKDYGTYNVVAGFIGILSFVTGTLGTSISRFITFELGKKKGQDLQAVFSTSLSIMLLLSIIIIILAETVGVWYVSYKMNIPQGRESAAMWVFQLSILTCCLGLMCGPYNAVVIAHEKMTAFAYISILDSVMKLIIVFLIQVSSVDKLILYAVLMALSAVILRMIYLTYSKRHFPECNYKVILKKDLFKRIMSFTFWGIFGGGVYILTNQVITLLINSFFGVVLNAAQGIANMINNVANSFANNFGTSLTPQITKSYAANELDTTHSLVYKGARFSYYLLLIIALPIIFEAQEILLIWLPVVPDYAVVFVRFTLIILLILILSNTMVTLICATAKLKIYQISIGALEILVIPITYMCYKLHYPPYSFYIVQLISFIFQLFVRMLFAKILSKGFSVSQFMIDVLFRILIVTIIAAIPLSFIVLFMNESFFRLLFICLTSTFSIFVSVYTLGLTIGERRLITNKTILFFHNKIIKK